MEPESATLLDSTFLLGVLASLVAAILFAVISWGAAAITSWKKRKQFYRDLDRFFQRLTCIRAEKGIEGESIREIVKALSDTFGEDFVAPRRYDRILNRISSIIPPRSTPESEDAHCWVCDLESKKVAEVCKYCKFSCRAWEMT